MKKKQDKNDDMAKLRARAEKHIGTKIRNIREEPRENLEEVIHELSVYQIELELQNDELYRTQDELEESRSKYADLYDFAPIGYFTIDKQGLIIEANLTGCKMLGIERKNLIKKPFHRFVAGKSQDTFYKHQQASFVPGLMRTCEIELVDVHGNQSYVRLDSIPVTSDNEHVDSIRTAVIDITKQRKAQEQVKSLAKFPDEDPFPVLRINEDGTIAYCNAPGKIILEDWKCQIGQKVPPDWYFFVHETLKSNQYLVKELHSGGRIFSMTVAPVKDVGYVNLYGRDITETRRAQHAVAQRERKYRRLFNTMSEGFAIHETIVDENGKPYDFRFLEVNPAFEALTGLNAIEIVGKTIKEVIPETNQSVIDEFGEVVLTGISKKFDMFSKNFNKYLEIFAFRPSAGQLADIFTDISERKKAEEDLRLANERLELAQRSAGAGTWDWNMAIDRLMWSRELFDLFGLDPSENEASFETWGNITHPDDRQITSDRIDEAIRNHTQLNSESRIVMPSGEVRWICALGNTTYDKHGKALRMSGICIDITERKHAEELLRYHAGLVDNMSDAVMSMDKDLTILSWNRAAEKMYGWRADEVTGKSVRKFIEPEYSDNSTTEGVIRQLFEVGKWAGEIIQKRKDGTKFYVSASLTEIKNASGENIGFIAVDRDITERRRAEEALRESEIRYRTVGDTIPYGVWHTNAEGQCTYVSDSFLEMTGMTWPQLQEFGWLHLLPDEDIQPTKEYWLHCVKTGENFEKEHRYLAKDGKTHYVLAIGRPVQNDKGEIASWVGINLDITERKQAEEALHEREDRLKIALEASAGAIYSHSVPLDESTYLDERWAQILGYRPEEIPDYNNFMEWLREQVHPDDLEIIQRAYDDFVEGRNPVYNVEIRLKNKQGYWIWVQDRSLATERDKIGRVKRIVGVMHDITKRKEAENVIRQRNEDLTRFNKYAVGRELRMIELKKEINSLCEVIGQPPRYKVDFDKENENEKSVYGKLSKDARG